MSAASAVVREETAARAGGSGVCTPPPGNTATTTDECNVEGIDGSGGENATVDGRPSVVGGTRGGACLGQAVEDTHTGARTVVIGREVGRNIMGRATGGGAGRARVCVCTERSRCTDH